MMMMTMMMTVAFISLCNCWVALDYHLSRRRSSRYCASQIFIPWLCFTVPQETLKSTATLYWKGQRYVVNLPYSMVEYMQIYAIYAYMQTHMILYAFWMLYSSCLATLCYHLPSLSHCFTLSLKPTFSENLILHLSLFLSVGLISWL